MAGQAALDEQTFQVFRDWRLNAVNKRGLS